MKRSRLARLGLWLTLALTANANRRHFHLTTAWVPHGAFNSFTLFFPEIADQLLPPANGQVPAPDTAAAIEDTLRAMVCDNPNYALYVTPAVLGYVLSHPSFNIYKGDLAKIRVLGFGLDAIPHSVTAAALCLLIFDTLPELRRRLPPLSALAPLTRWADEHRAFVSALALAVLTAVWEGGEYLVQQSELRARDYDYSKINMDWTVEDTIFDVLANFLGWAAVSYARRGG